MKTQIANAAGNFRSSLELNVEDKQRALIVAQKELDTAQILLTQFEQVLTAASATVEQNLRQGRTQGQTQGRTQGRAQNSNPSAAEGRRAVARGDRPVLKDAMEQVMGRHEMSADEVILGLQAKGWLPNSGNPKQYISYMLSSTKDVFEPVRRGIYRVLPSIAAAAKKSNGHKGHTDDKLESLGLSNVEGNPFSG